MLCIDTYIRRGMTLVVPLFLVLAACSNDQQQVQKVIDEYDGPLRVQQNVEYTYTDSGVVKLIFEADKAIDYSHLEEDDAYLEFPDGIYVRFFNDAGQLETTLKADYAIQYIAESRWEAKGDVQVDNAKSEHLETEKLEWDQNTQRISSEEAVTITTPESKIWGKGFDADQNMNDYEIHEVIGTIYLDESEPDSTQTENL